MLQWLHRAVEMVSTLAGPQYARLKIPQDSHSNLSIPSQPNTPASLMPQVDVLEQRLPDDVLWMIADLHVGSLPPASLRKMLAAGRVFLHAGLSSLYGTLNLNCSKRSVNLLHRIG
jgi:hypothetical protein